MGVSRSRTMRNAFDSAGLVHSRPLRPVNHSPSTSSVLMVPLVPTALLTGFICCYSAGERFPVLVRLAALLGAAMVGLAVFRWARTGIRMPSEIGLLCLFVIWAVGSGVIRQVDANLFLSGVKRMIQVVLFAGFVASVAATARTPGIGFLAITGLGLTLVGYSFLTGDFAAGAGVEEHGGRVVGNRAVSLTSNANSLGVACVWALAGLAFAWRKANRMWQQTILVLLSIALLAGAVYSGSRKAAVLVPIFLLAWAWFCYRSLILRKAQVLFFCIVVAAGVGFTTLYVMENTFVGYRLRQAMSANDRDNSTELRLSMIQRGLQMLAESPLAGVGLYQYAPASGFDTYAHNDYVEVAATTGLVGFFGYYSVFAVAVLRLVRVRRLSRNADVRYVAGLCLAVLIMAAATGFALIMFTGIPFWCLVSPILGFAYTAESHAAKVAFRRKHASMRAVRLGVGRANVAVSSD